MQTSIGIAKSRWRYSRSREGVMMTVARARFQGLRKMSIALEISFLIGLLRATVFWGAIAAFVCRFGFDVEFAAMHRPPADSTLEWFYALNFCALLASPLLILGRLMTTWLDNHFLHWWSREPMTSVLYGLQGDAANPLRGLRAIYTSGIVTGRGHNDTGLRGIYSHLLQILHFTWSLAIIAYLAGGFVLISRNR